MAEAGGKQVAVGKEVKELTGGVLEESPCVTGMLTEIFNVHRV